MKVHHQKTIKSFGTPQVSKVLDHLLKYGSITGNKAQDYRIRALPRRISDIEEIMRAFHMPYSIKRTWQRDLEGQRYMEYSILEKEAAR